MGSLEKVGPESRVRNTPPSTTSVSGPDEPELQVRGRDDVALRY